jgi:hypothetical protein
MLNRKTRLAFSLGVVLFLASTFSVSAVDYNLGVEAGHYVTYGNFVGVGEIFQSFNDTDWLKIEIVEVTGKEATLLTTGRLKNGNAIPGSENMTIWNVETGTQDDIPAVFGPIIASNLNVGDAVPPPDTFAVNKTEDRFYMGDLRSVNIVSSGVTAPGFATMTTYVYDRISGILLETEKEITETQPSPTTSRYSYSIIETNIFGTATHPTQPQDTGIPAEYLPVVVAVVAVVVFITVLVFRKRMK